MTDIEKILEGRKVVDAYRLVHAGLATTGQQEKDVAHESIELDMAQGLEKLGFTTDEFFALNKRIVFEIFSEYRPRYGECDFCEGYSGVPRCKELYGDGSCFVTGEIATEEIATKVRFIRYLKGEHKWLVAEFLAEATISGDRYYSVCPPGHGYYGLVAELKEFPFDMAWR